MVTGESYLCYKTQLIPKQLYNRLQNSPTSVIERFRDFNRNNCSLCDYISPVPTRAKTNIMAANAVLEERAR